VLGAIISVAHNPSKKRWHSLINLIAGVSTAIILPPIIVSHFRLDPNLIGGLGFLVGLIGKDLCDWVIESGKDPLAFSRKLASWWVKK
jgi:hypothetical protein